MAISAINQWATDFGAAGIKVHLSEVDADDFDYAALPFDTRDQLVAAKLANVMTLLLDDAGARGWQWKAVADALKAAPVR